MSFVRTAVPWWRPWNSSSLPCPEATEDDPVTAAIRRIAEAEALLREPGAFEALVENGAKIHLLANKLNNVCLIVERAKLLRTRRDEGRDPPPR